MKRTTGLFVAFLLFILSACNARKPEPIAISPPAPQILNPVKWEWRAEPTGKGEYNLIFTAKIDKGFHTYSQYIGPNGPVATSFKFDSNTNVQLIGKTSETGPKVHEGHDPVFDMQLKYFEESLVCTQHVKVLMDAKLKGTLEYMCCDDTKCLPPDDKDFEFDLKAGAAAAPINDQPAKTKVGKTGGNNTILPAGQMKFDSSVQAVITKSIQQDSAKAVANVSAAPAANKYGEPVSNCGEEKKTFTVWLSILLGFGAGLVALLTPCVFPMIPLTVSFFLKRSESKSKGRSEALLYSFSIVFIYLFLSLLFAVFNISPDTFNEISTGSILNVFFFLIFVVFAISFFGYYEITLPSFIANKADSASNLGGIVGIFFMALTLFIVSFSCTGPILGSLLVFAYHSGGKLSLVAGMTSFGLALALPFGLFALFPNMMKSLPKSGGWLNSVKVVIGFVELIFAIKFLSNADLVAHWGILKREVFLGLWVFMGTGLVAYLVGWLKFPHDSANVKLSPVRIGATLIALAFTVYAAYGIPGNDLSLFSGFPPPKFYSIFKTNSKFEPIKNDYEAAIAKAKAEHKLVMIDFTGWACVNCRKMEENVWPDAEVMKRLTERYVIVSLYVDDKQELPVNEQHISDFENKKIRTIGNKYSEMEARYFGSNTQPYYVLISPDEKLLTTPRGYTPNAQEYVSFLDCGWNSSKQLSQK